MKKSQNYLALFILILVMLSSCKTENKPNVVFILTDQWRA